MIKVQVQPVDGSSSSSGSSTGRKSASKGKKHRGSAGGSSSPRSSKVGNNSKSNKYVDQQKDQTSNRKMFFSMLVGLYVLIILSFTLQYVVSPGRARDLTQASLATTNTQNKNKNNNGNNKKKKQTLEITADNFHILQDADKFEKVLGNSELELQIKGSNGELKNFKATLQKNDESTVGTTITVDVGIVNGYKYSYCPIVYAETAAAASTSVSQEGIVSSSSNKSPSGAKEINGRDIVVLDGGKYNRENGDFTEKDGSSNFQGPNGNVRLSETTFLELCSAAQKSGVITSVTAVEYVGANSEPETLLRILRGLIQQKVITSLPLAAIVTPRESTNAIVDWILYGDIEKLLGMAKHWIAVSTPQSVLQAATSADNAAEEHDNVVEHVSVNLNSGGPLQVISGWPVLAIYGSNDKIGRQGAELLHEQANAQTLQIDGGVMCYKDSTRDFATAIAGFLQPKFSQLSRAHHGINIQLESEK